MNCVFDIISYIIYDLYYEYNRKKNIIDSDIIMKTIYKIKSITEKNNKPYPNLPFIYNYFHKHCKENIIYKLLIEICSNEFYYNFIF